MTWIIRILFLAILLALLYSFVPEGPLRGILGCVMGLVLLLAFLQPVGDFLKDKSWSWLQLITVEHIEGEHSTDEKNVILTEYQEKCESTIASYVTEMAGVAACRADVLVNEEWGSSSFGNIQHVYLYVEFGETENESITWIPPIVILPEVNSGTNDFIQEIEQSVATWLQIDVTCVTAFEEG